MLPGRPFGSNPQSIGLSAAELMRCNQVQNLLLENFLQVELNLVRLNLLPQLFELCLQDPEFLNPCLPLLSSSLSDRYPAAGKANHRHQTRTQFDEKRCCHRLTASEAK